MHINTSLQYFAQPPVCGTEGKGTGSHRRVCWSYHTSKHMAEYENMTEMTILVCVAVQAAVQLRATNAASIKAQLARSAPALHTHRFCAAHVPLKLAV